jgi:NAD(P)-dependent dehydrogenase (short-subunit alcohol dehydrogenase family)
MTTKSTVLILGGSRGLGLAMAEEWLKRDAKVIATQRSASRDLSELQGRYPGSLEIETVDIVDAASVHALCERLGGRRIDVLFVNAGICKAHEETPATADERDFVDMMLTNALGPMRAVELLENLVPANGAIAVMTCRKQRRLGALQLQQGRPQYADEMLLDAPRWRSTRALAGRARLGPHRDGDLGRNVLDRTKHPIRRGNRRAKSRPGRPALHRSQRSNLALVNQKHRWNSMHPTFGRYACTQ